DVAVGYWEVGIFGAVAVGVGGWYDPYTDDEWGDGTIDDDAPPDDSGDPGDDGADDGSDTGGDDGSDDDAFQPMDLAAGANGCFACTLTCVYAAPADQANAVTSVGASGSSYYGACANAERQLGRWGQAHRTRFLACKAPDGGANRVPARPGVN